MGELQHVVQTDFGTLLLQDEREQVMEELTPKLTRKAAELQKLLNPIYRAERQEGMTQAERNDDDMQTLFKQRDYQIRSMNAKAGWAAKKQREAEAAPKD